MSEENKAHGFRAGLGQMKWKVHWECLYMEFLLI